jgi:2-oxoglutarate dehydrogenase E2 component (dihydrolipoamide succinyltransferase)
MYELEGIAGTGNEGRVTKKDILQYVSNRNQEVSKPASQKEEGQQAAVYGERSTVNSQQKKEISQSSIKVEQPATSNQQSETVYEGNVEVIEMDRMRKLIAKHMVNSKQTSAHVTSFAEADVTNMVLWREKNKKEFEKQNNTKITYTPIFIDCLVRVMKRYPIINSSVDGDKIIIKKDFNIGMATALPNGNLIVPVIKNADELNLVGLAKRVNNLADAGRNNKLKPEDIQDGTFSLTNVGTFGSLMGTPIINQPQVAILAVGAIKKRPVVIETEQGDTIGIRHMMYLSLSYDHRIVDGSLGASFLTAVAKEFEHWDLNKGW